MILSILSLIILSPLSPNAVAAENQPPFADSVSGELLPMLQAGGAILIDDETGETICSINERKRLYPASTTKVLTALLAIEQGNLNETVTVGNEIFLSPPGSSSAGLNMGEKISLRELIYALMLPSGNDAANCVAVYLARKASPDKTLTNRQALKVFADMMNRRARQLGANYSHFVNPHGYHDANHYSTPADMALIAHQAMKYPFFREVVGTPAFTPKQSGTGHYSKVWQNTNQLLQKDSPYLMKEATGIKTGHTSQAGYCLISSATQGNARVLAVVLNSTPKGVFTDSVYLLKYGLAHYPVHIPKPPSDDKDYPYIKNINSLYSLMLLCTGVYMATRVLSGRLRRH